MRKLAIIIPYYKIDFFEETLKSVASQSNRNFSLYIGNDASPNNPVVLIQKYFKEHEYKYYEYSKNIGASNLALQWQRILENVHEEWFHILGDDDIISENFVQEFYTNLDDIEKENINVVKFSQALIDERRNIITEFTQYKTIENSVSLWQKKFHLNHRSSLSEHIFRKKTFDIFRFKEFPLAWHTDDLAVLEYSYFKNIFFINNATVLVRVSSLSISGDTENDSYNKKKIEAKYQFIGFVINNYYSQLDRDVLQLMIKTQIEFCWIYKKKLNINLFKLYYYLKSYKQILGIPRKCLLLLTNRKPYLTFKHYSKLIEKTYNYLHYFLSIKLNKNLKKQRQNPKSIPVIIINYNQLYYLKILVNFLQERKFENIIIVDNNSDYPPLLEYYKSIKEFITIETMSSNLGHLVFFENKDLQKKYGNGYFVLTDPDIVPNSNLPEDFLGQMIAILDDYFSTTTKVGFALDLETIPDTFPLKQKVLKWEKKFWKNKLKDNLYRANIDTTFALYKPYYPKHYKDLPFFQGVRVADQYTAIHGGWYIDPLQYSEENLHYINSVDKSSSWKLDNHGKHDNKGTAVYKN